MTTQLNVENAIERDLGTKFEIRFWLSTEINGRKVESRGTVVTIEKPTVADAREWATGTTKYIAMRMGNDELAAKEANAKLPEYIKEVQDQDVAWNDFIENTWNKN